MHHKHINMRWKEGSNSGRGLGGQGMPKTFFYSFILLIIYPSPTLPLPYQTHPPLLGVSSPHPTTQAATTRPYTGVFSLPDTSQHSPPPPEYQKHISGCIFAFHRPRNLTHHSNSKNTFTVTYSCCCSLPTT